MLRGKLFHLGGRERHIKTITVLVALFFFVAITAILAASALDSSGGCGAVIEASPSLAGEWIEKDNTTKAGALGEAVVGTSSNIYIAWCRYCNTSPQFWRYDPIEDKWNYSMSNSSLPRGAFRNGAALAWDGDNYIYALSGGRYEDLNRYSFYRYEISEDRGEQLNDTRHPQGAGDALTWCGYDKRIYAMMGKSTSSHGGIHYGYFARYDPDNDRWDKLNLTQNWTCTDDGASLVWTGKKYLYALQGEIDEDNGSKNNNFSRYDIVNNRWENMADIQEGSCGAGDGGSLLWIGNRGGYYANYIFALGGGCANEEPGYNFYAYNISNNSWESLPQIRCPIGVWVGNRLGFADGHTYYWQGSPSTWSCGGNAFFMFVPKPTALITTDKTTYTTGDTMTITINISNPTEGSVTFQWYWGVHQYSIWTSVMSVPIPEGYDDTHDFSFTIPDWGSTPFGNVFYVQLLNANGGVLDAEAECWAYSPSGKVALAVDIREKIKKAIKWWSSDEERKGNETSFECFPAALRTTNGWINCTEFIDANGKRYNDWTPAIKRD